jgi:hypothetical protein
VRARCVRDRPFNTLRFDRSGKAAIAITGMSAYSNGFEIFVTALIEPGAGFDAETPDRGMLANRPYQLSLQLSDGRTVTIQPSLRRARTVPERAANRCLCGFRIASSALWAVLSLPRGLSFRR